MTLKEKLTKSKKTRWLDIGNGGNFEKGFYYLDILPVKKEYKRKYFKKNIAKLSKKDIKEIGKYDLVRMQHVFEHFEFEDIDKILTNCSELLNKNGYLLITTPDLRVHINKYLNDDYKKWEEFGLWAYKRIPKDSPNSFYFSIFAHSMPWEQHRWCYDFEGLEYLIKKSKKFKNVRELKITSKLSSNPFTHNRPEEDVCLLAQLK